MKNIFTFGTAAAAAYLLMIMPRMWRKADKAPFMGVMYAHRGLHDDGLEAPENSLAAFRRAVDAGYGIELDVQLSRDKVPVVFHDGTLKRMCGTEGKVKDCTLAQLKKLRLGQSQERIPTLQEALDLVDGKVPLIVEMKIGLKEKSVCPEADALLRGYGGKYCIESFNPMGVFWYRRNRPEVMRGQLSSAFCGRGKKLLLMRFLLENLMFNFLAKPDFVAYNHENQGNLSRRLCHGLFRNTAVAWTIRSEKELEKARRHFDLFIFEDFVPSENLRA